MALNQHSIPVPSEDEDFDILVCGAVEDLDNEFDSKTPRIVTLPGSPQKKIEIRDRVFDKPFFWTTGQKLRIGFLGGTDWQQGEVKKYAPEWTIYANLEFEFVDKLPYDITIDFKPGNSSSLLGTNSHKKAHAIPPAASMNLGWVDLKYPVERYRGTILHEFGHALGRTHEHQNSLADIDWDLPKLYANFAKKGWSPERVNHNVLAKCDGVGLAWHHLDPDSIMLYTFSKDLLKNSPGLVRNHELSYFDKAYMLAGYPGRDKQTLPKDFNSKDLRIQRTLNGPPFIWDYKKGCEFEDDKDDSWI